MFEVDNIGSYIRGEVRSFGQKEPLISPTLGKEWGKIRKATDEDITLALKVIQERPRIEGTIYERAHILRNIAKLLEENKESLATCITLEMGKPIAEARGEVTYAINYFSWFAEEIKRTYGLLVPSSKPNKRLEVRYEPIGPCAIITPWNFPLAMAARKIAPAFAAGCPVIAKPSSFTPVTIVMFASLLANTAAPSNALQVLVGDSKTIGEALLNDPAIRKFSFTGSYEVGKTLYTKGAHTLKKCTLELGGNAPFIVFDDADIERAAQEAVFAKFRMSGQTCICANRFFIHKKVLVDFLHSFSERVKKLPIGNPLEEETELSTVLHPLSLGKTKAHMQDALNKGAKAHLGAKEPYEPEILTQVNPEMVIFNEETFGPIAPIIEFTDEEEVICLANKTQYGLAAYLFTENIKRAERMISALEFGMIGLNDGLLSAPETSFGGIKASGFGREGGPTGIYEYLTEKCISTKL